MNLTFDSNIISQRINKCETRPPKMDDIPVNRLKFMLIVEQLIVFLCLFVNLLVHTKPINLVDSLKLNDKDWGKLTLTKEEIGNILRKQTTLKK